MESLWLLVVSSVAVVFGDELLTLWRRVSTATKIRLAGTVILLALLVDHQRELSREHSDETREGMAPRNFSEQSKHDDGPWRDWGLTEMSWDDGGLII